jgi:RNA polymerase sigma-70 factor (ECF subfamily)
VDTDNALLIERSKTGDSNAFAQLYSLYAVDLYRFAVYMMGNTHDAEDAVQEAVFSAWRNIHTLKENAVFKVWIFKILSNRCKTELMKKNKAPDILPIEEYTFLIDEAYEDFIGTDLKEALHNLTPPDAQIILLSIIGGFKSYELAEIFSMEPATVRSRQKRALEKLRKILS